MNHERSEDSSGEDSEKAALARAAQTLSESPAAYFTPHPQAVMLSLDRLVPTRRRPEGVRNAVELMASAARGEIPRRAPIQVRPVDDGRYEIIDGNSTFAVAVLARWTALPCLVVAP